MIRLTKLADYGIVLVAHMAGDPKNLHTASHLAKEAHVSVPTASKILKLLARKGILESHRGANGGYTLAREPAAISVAQVIAAMEGPIAVTECIEDTPGECVVEDVCRVRANWQKINDAVRGALEQITLQDMAQPFRELPEPAPDTLVHIGTRAV